MQFFRKDYLFDGKTEFRPLKWDLTENRIDTYRIKAHLNRYSIRVDNIVQVYFSVDA